MADDDDNADDARSPTLRHKPERTRVGFGTAFPLPSALRDSSPTLGVGTVRTAAANEPPTILNERYTLGAPLGQGGMGEVLLARDEHIGRDVAIKRIRAVTPTDEERARFVREARVQGALEHPAIVPVHDLTMDHEGRPYFVMKRLTGTEMHEVLKRMRSGDDPDEAGSRRRLLRAFADVCLAVEFAHARDVIHRDLKPANIMLGDFGEVYVIDWGLARRAVLPDDMTTTLSMRAGGRAAASSSAPLVAPMALGSQHALNVESGETQLGAVLGTPAYMAPEQLAGDRVDASADIYALGCILYEILAGEPLHPRTRTLGQALTLADARPSLVRPDSPPELDAVCQRATAILPEDRYPSARALGAAVQAYLDGNRDVVVRKELAVRHVEEAQAALARVPGDAHEAAQTAARIDAIRAAGRALALDPTSTAAADLVGHIMLQPPRDVPEEVTHEIAAEERDAARSQGLVGMVSMLLYLTFIPFLFWTGVHSLVLVALICVCAVAGAAHIYYLTRGEQIVQRQVYLNAVINAVLVGCVERLVGPFFIGPSLLVATMMMFSIHPRFGRTAIIAMILGTGLALPWFLETIGVLAPTYYFDAGKLVIASPAIEFTPAPTNVAGVAIVVVLLVTTARLLRTIAYRQRDVTRRLGMQAWHLRQIVPTSQR